MFKLVCGVLVVSIYFFISEIHIQYFVLFVRFVIKGGQMSSDIFEKIVFNNYEQQIKAHLILFLFYCVNQVVLSVLVAVVAAKPGLIHSPIVAAPYTKIIQPAPLLVQSNEHVSSVVNHVPTSVSAQSSSVVHR